MPRRGVIVFYECEHNGDLDSYLTDLRRCPGVKILGSTVDEDAEEGRVMVEVADLQAFIAAFRQTGAYGFSNMA